MNSVVREFSAALMGALVLLVLMSADDARATCYPEGETRECSVGVCLGTQTCDTYWSRCQLSGESTVSCSVCGRQGTVSCDSSGNLISGTCSAYLSYEICNGCDDDGDGQVDEDIPPQNPPYAPCDPKGNGCYGDVRCVNGGWACVVRSNQYLSCADQCGGASARKQCNPDGSVGVCMRDTAVSETCNGCDDDRDGIIDNAPGQGTSSVTRSCVSTGGACPGSTETCRNGSWSGVCSAPPEICNGLDDDCDSSIDEGGVCRMDSLACTCTPTTCAAQGKNCGSIPDGCGGTLNCGTCGSNQTCTSNVCVASCTPTTCAAQNRQCGTIPDGCGGTLTCGTCSTGLECVDNRFCDTPCPTGEYRCCDNSCSVNNRCYVEFCLPPPDDAEM